MKKNLRYLSFFFICWKKGIFRYQWPLSSHLSSGVMHLPTLQRLWPQPGQPGLTTPNKNILSPKGPGCPAGVKRSDEISPGA